MEMQFLAPNHIGIDAGGVTVVVEGEKTPFEKGVDSLKLITDKSEFPVKSIPKGTKITVTGINFEFRY